MRPLVIVTTALAPGRRLPQVVLNANYVTAVEDAGATAVLLSPAHDIASIEALVDRADGLVLTGGDDVDPARYGQTPHPKTGAPNRARDEAEFAALELALKREMPVLAICRGMQVLNVALGGTLVQDLSSQRPGPIVHEQTAPIGQRWHAAEVLDGSGLHQIFGTSELFINSFHHQGVDRLAPPLRAAVWAEDGLVEGVEGKEFPWVYGVQWHPERGEAEAPADERDPDRRLFWAFTRAAEAFASDGALNFSER